MAKLDEHGTNAAGFAADVTDLAGLTSTIGQAQDRFGTIDVLEYSPTPTGPKVLATPHPEHGCWRIMTSNGQICTNNKLLIREGFEVVKIIVHNTNTAIWFRSTKDLPIPCFESQGGILK